MRICAYVNLRGNALEALQFYSGIFRTEPEYMTYADAPANAGFPVTEEMKHMVLHGEVFLDKEQSIMIADDLRPGEGEMGSAIVLTLLMEDETEQRRIFAALAEGGTVLMPLTHTFWSANFGTVKDRFGLIWHSNLCRKPVC